MSNRSLAMEALFGAFYSETAGTDSPADIEMNDPAHPIYTEGEAAVSMSVIPNYGFETGGLTAPYEFLDNDAANSSGNAPLLSGMYTTVTSTANPAFATIDSSYAATFTNGATVRMNDELMILTSNPTDIGGGKHILRMSRGQFDTSIVAHSIGDTIYKYGGAGLFKLSTSVYKNGSKSLYIKAGKNNDAYTMPYHGSSGRVWTTCPGGEWEISADFYVPSDANQSSDWPSTLSSYPITMFVFGNDASGNLIGTNPVTKYSSYTSSMEPENGNQLPSSKNFSYEGTGGTSGASNPSYLAVKWSRSSIPRDEWFRLRFRMRFGNHPDIRTLGVRIDNDSKFKYFYVDNWEVHSPGIRMTSVWSGSDLYLDNPAGGQDYWN